MTSTESAYKENSTKPAPFGFNQTEGCFFYFRKELLQYPKKIVVTLIGPDYRIRRGIPGTKIHQQLLTINKVFTKYNLYDIFRGYPGEGRAILPLFTGINVISVKLKSY